MNINQRIEIISNHLMSHETSHKTLSTISTHVLDTTTGLPARDMKVYLEKDMGSNQFEVIKNVVTNSDGRAREFPELENGNYRITFLTEEYFVNNNVSNYFFPKATIDFIVNQPRHYHVPLLLSPFSYSTYRGS
ncbi:hypothetical protein DICPUDRAFT_46037 [Dictyostelium purpureum]|uniref:5-hydroxyisourate hydrolase n=1 Tax=Dictyostelium purpureum TaxID=5786 RepID=F0ZD80_DICPU|nr:uncharacterized protein DICPUDRAFT_46037 [Dictyostelium purpureum]EGC38089.1 hypothetical protein DICPUDRAFT_46037 [Dictyostelium purpureum]|eukprot:XP_003285396.1 hypothetical protein DICPUDRAFT_46037 [Dictyostelium purpureum]